MIAHVHHTPAVGLSEHQAAARLINTVQSELSRFEKRKARSQRDDRSRLLLLPGVARRLPGTLTYFCTEDGFLGGICLLLMLLGIVLWGSGPFRSPILDPDLPVPGVTAFPWPLVYSAAILLPYLVFNSYLYYSARRVETTRSAAQVKEALQLYERCLWQFDPSGTITAADAERTHLASEYEIPACCLISVLRSGRWRRLPYNLVVEGDVIKLRYGDMMPCDSLMCVLRRKGAEVTISEDNASSPEWVLEIRGELWKQGEVFGVPSNRRTHQRMSPTLVYATFIALQTPCAVQVSRFLETSDATGARDQRMRSRLETPFFDIVEMIHCNILRRLGWTLVILGTIIYFTRFFVGWAIPPSYAANEAILWPQYPYSMPLQLISAIVLMQLAFSPIVGRLLLDLTDLWGNARLQSHFLFHHERRYSRSDTFTETRASLGRWSLWRARRVRRHRAHTHNDHKDSIAGSVRRNSNSSTSSTGSFISETGLSRPSSADTNLSISRVPITKQLQELRNVFHQGLDGECNLLHSLASTTYLCFLDHEGLLTETCHRIEEVAMVSKSDDNEEDKQDHLTYSSSFEKRLKPVVLAVQETRRDEGFHVQDVGGGEESDGASTSKSEDSVGLRFVVVNDGQKYMTNLRPLATAMRSTQLPSLALPPSMSVGWLHTLRLRDYFQRELFETDRWQACLCALAGLCGVGAADVGKFLPIVRHILVVSSEQATPARIRARESRDSVHTSETDTSDDETLDGHDVTLLDSPLYHQALAVNTHSNLSVMKISLVKDHRDNKLQLFAKGSTDDLLHRCRFCFDGETIAPMTTALISRLEAVVMQWKSEGYHAFGFGYSALPSSYQTFLLHSLEEHTVLSVHKQRRRRGAEETVGEVWRPLLVNPGPRSVQLRPEPFVLPLDYVNRHTARLEPTEEEIQHPQAPGDEDIPLASSEFAGSHLKRSLTGSNIGPAVLMLSGGDGAPVLNQETAWRILNYNNAIVLVDRSSGQRNSLRNVKSEASFARARRALNVIGETEGDENAIAHQISWLPVRTARLGGELLKRIVDRDLVLLGLAAIRQQAPSTVIERISDFHSAGVRFLLFSKENLQSTRVLGNLLGLETGWNCMISLEECDKDAVYINQDGNAVLPAGIAGIKNHLRDVDDIPLLVSLYANASPPTTRQMLRILRKRGEVVTCVGSALRTSNFDLFNETDCPVSILLLPYPLCQECNGRRSLGAFYHPMLLPEFSFSAALTSLPCALQSHAVSAQLTRAVQRCHELVGAHRPPVDLEPYPAFLLQLLYSSFQEARRIVAAIEMVLIYYGLCCCGVVGLTLTCISFFAFPPILSTITSVSLTFVILPIPSLSLLFNPVRNSTMLDLPRGMVRRKRQANLVKVTEEPDLASVSSSDGTEQGSSPGPKSGNRILKQSIITHAARLIIPVVGAIALCLSWLRWAIMRTHIYNTSPTADPLALERRQAACYDDWYVGGAWFTGKWSRCFFYTVMTADPSAKAHDSLMVGLSALGMALCMLQFIAFALCSVSKFESIFVMKPWENTKLIPAIIVAILITVAIESSVLTVYQVWYTIYVPPWWWWVTAVGGFILTILAAEACKWEERRQHRREQKFLRLVFNTRLGMWSPK